ncbi:MAG: peptidylprolyl isomerase [Spirulina sp. SIO3F2]|nr:peptidylprolyl isomerase [Spirulina sp. SIO3F2]
MIGSISRRRQTPKRQPQKGRFRQWLYSSLVALLMLGAIAVVNVSPAQAGLAQGNAITDPYAILQYALPIENQEVRRLQKSLEDLSEGLRTKRWSLITNDLKTARRSLNYGNDKILEDISAERQPKAESLIADLKAGVDQLEIAAEAKDRESIWTVRRQLLTQVGALEALMVEEFPFAVPEDYANLPQLKGRATVELTTNKGKMTVIADGYNAPVNAGNFVDLVKRGFYKGLPFFQNQDYIIQTGDPKGPEVGFIDPKTKQYRAIPLEVKVQEEEEPIYELTLEDVGLYLANLALPFNSYGAVALARPGDDPNGGSSQFFFFLYDSELTPPGFNVLDGRYSVFGYLVEGKDVLEALEDGDTILSAKVVSGLENLVEPR